MEYLSIGFVERKNQTRATHKREDDDKESEICQSESDKNDKAGSEQDQELSCRYRTDNLIFYIDELRDYKLLHTLHLIT